MSERSPRGTTSTHPAPAQLRLLTGGEPAPDWQLDERTRRVGRRGVAEAREILRRVHPPEPKASPQRKAS